VVGVIVGECLWGRVRPSQQYVPRVYGFKINQSSLYFRNHEEDPDKLNRRGVAVDDCDVGIVAAGISYQVRRVCFIHIHAHLRSSGDSPRQEFKLLVRSISEMHR